MAQLSGYVADHQKRREMIDEKKAIFTIGVEPQALSVYLRTLRIYEEEGLVTPMRKGKWCLLHKE